MKTNLIHYLNYVSETQVKSYLNGIIQNVEIIGQRAFRFFSRINILALLDLFKNFKEHTSRLLRIFIYQKTLKTNLRFGNRRMLQKYARSKLIVTHKKPFLKSNNLSHSLLNIDNHFILIPSIYSSHNSQLCCTVLFGHSRRWAVLHIKIETRHVEKVWGGGGDHPLGLSHSFLPAASIHALKK